MHNPESLISASARFKHSHRTPQSPFNEISIYKYNTPNQHTHHVLRYYFKVILPSPSIIYLSACNMSRTLIFPDLMYIFTFFLIVRLFVQYFHDSVCKQDSNIIHMFSSPCLIVYFPPFSFCS